MSSKTIYSAIICSCIFCRKECSILGISSHIRSVHTHVEENKNKLKLASYANKKINESKKLERISQYISNPNKCAVCDDILDFDKRFNKFCGSSCSAKNNNQIRGQKTTIEKIKISNGVKNYIKKNPKPLYTKVAQCKWCSKFFNKSIRTNSSNCSDECTHQIRSYKARNNSGLGTKRSKDEIRLFELIKNKFNNVTANEKIANGWDADILIYDIKVAILWNGPWHYKEMKLSNHSLKQVKNRDTIKIKEFNKIGWEVVIFEDRFYTPEKAFNEVCDRWDSNP